MQQLISPLTSFDPQITYDPVNLPHSWFELLQSALAHNAQQFRTLIGPYAQLSFVIKSNAYGHGLIPIAQMAEKIKDINWLCVFSLSEALQLRTNGITKPILVLGHIDADPALAAETHIDFMIDNVEIAGQLHRVATHLQTTFGVHIKIDTGLSRFGIMPAQLSSFLAALKQFNTIQIKGAFTHLSEAQQEDQTFTLHQLQQFDECVTQIEQQVNNSLFIHAASSAATMLQLGNKYNFFRIGLGMYGLYPSDSVQQYVQQQQPNFSLQPLLTWKSKIIAIKQVPPDTYISYNRTYQTMQPTTLGIIPVGYQDGLHLLLSNKTHVIINHHRVPVLGRIAMNATIIDITQVNAQLNDIVTLIDNSSITCTHLAQLAGYDNIRHFLTQLSPHLQRFIID